MKILTRCLLAVGAALCTLPARADTMSVSSITSAATNPNDLSRQMLVTIFGDVVNNPFNPGQPSMIGQLFAGFNAVIASIAMVWFLFVTLRSLVKSGHKGSLPVGTAMSLLSAFAGFISLVPTGSGWSLAQLLILWAASVMGVGSANVLTDIGADALASGQSMVVQPVAPKTVSAAHSIFEMNLCMFGINTELRTMYEGTGDGSSTDGMMGVKALSDGFEIGNGSALCGSAHLPPAADNSSAAAALKFDVPVDTTALQAAQKNALTVMQNTLMKDAQDFASAYLQKAQQGTGTLPDAETLIQDAAGQYENTINAAIQKNNGNQLQAAVITQLKQYGWLSLGSFYQTFATANTKTAAVAQMVPVVSGPSNIGEVGAGDVYQQMAIAYKSQQQNSTYTAPLGTVTSKDTQLVADGKDPTSVFVNLFSSPGQHLANLIATMNIGSDADTDTNTQMNPLIKMKTIGDYTLGTAESIFALYTTARVLTNLDKGDGPLAWGAKFLNALSGGAGDVASSVLDALSPAIYFLLFILFSIGFSLSIFLPMTPFIYWISGATNWIVGVLIGATAGTLWAATHLGVEEDKGSRSAYGYVFLIDVMLRPMLMVFGFFFASLVVVAVGTLLDALFAPAIANMQANSITGLVSVVGILMVYSRICTTLVSKAFSLQVTMPDYVISWLGGREGANMLGGMTESVQNMFAGFGSGVSRAPTARKIEPKENTAPDDSADGVKK